MAAAVFDFVARDVPRVVRRLIKAPLFSVVVIITLALAIGANGAVFTLIDQLLLRPLTVSQPETLVVVNAPSVPHKCPCFTSVRRGPDGAVVRNMNYDLFRTLTERVPLFERTLALTMWRGNVLVGQEPAEASGELVSGSYFGLLGIAPAIGRLMGPADDQPGAPRTAVLAHGWWQRQFGGDASVVGRTIRVSGFPVTVVGVAAAGFTGMAGARSSDLFIPLAMYDLLVPLPAPYGLRDTGISPLEMMARLRSGTTIQQAEVAADAIYQQLIADALGRGTFTAKDLEVIARQRLTLFSGGTAASRQGALTPQLLLALRLLMAMALLLLAISAANVTNLILAREVRRRRELAIRFALGAGRARMLGERLVESLLLALAAGGASVIISAWLADVLLGMLPIGPQQISVTPTPGPRVLFFTAGVAVASGLLIWLASSIQATRRSSLPTLSGAAAGGRGGSLRLRRGLLAMQAALSLALLCAASMLAHSLYNLTSVDPGFNTRGLTTFRIAPDSATQTSGKFEEVLRSTLDALLTMSGVQAVGATTELPLFTGGGTFVVGGRLPVDAETALMAGSVSVTPGYFAALGVPIIHGRDFAEADTDASPRVAIVNESLAKALFDDRNPVGQMIGLRYQSLDRRIVGVVKDTRTGVRTPPEPAMYLPWLQQPLRWALVVVRTPRDGMLDVSSVREVAARIDPAMPVTSFSTMTGMVAASLARDRMLALLSLAIGGLGALLCGLGLLGLMNYQVATRAREIGVRLALGAGARAIQWLVVRDALVVTLVGAPIGLAAYFASSHVLQSIVFGVSSTDVWTPTSGAVVLALVTVAAAWIPAHRAMTLDPAVALRRE